MPEMLRIDAETDHLIAAIQVILQIRTGYRISRIVVVRRALREMADEMKMPRLQEGTVQDEENDETGG